MKDGACIISRTHVRIKNSAFVERIIAAPCIITERLAFIVTIGLEYRIDAANVV